MSVIKKHKEGEFVIVHTCCLIVTTRDNALMRVYYYLMRTRALCLSANTVGISEQEVGGMMLLSRLCHNYFHAKVFSLP